MNWEYLDFKGEELPEYAENIPEVTLESLDQWVMRGRPTGDFLAAVLRHDLFDAMFRADEEHRRELHNLVMFIHNRLPGNCHGDAKTMLDWHELGGIEGQEAAKALEG